nr:carbohydrate porin [Sandaracinobacteroides sayramensis]
MTGGFGWRPASRTADLLGVGIGWSKPNDAQIPLPLPFDLRDQGTAEVFYRLAITPNFAVTPVYKLVVNPSLNPTTDTLWCSASGLVSPSKGERTPQWSHGEGAWKRLARRPEGLVAIAIAGQALGLLVTLVAARAFGVEAFDAYALAASLFILLATMAPLGGEKHALRHLPALFGEGPLGRARGLLRFGAAQAGIAALRGELLRWLLPLVFTLLLLFIGFAGPILALFRPSFANGGQ